MTSTATLPTLDSDDPRPFVSAIEAFTFLGIDRTTGYRAIHENTFPVPVIIVGRIYRVPTAALRRLLAGGEAVTVGLSVNSDAYTEPPTTDEPPERWARRSGSRSERTRSPSPVPRGRVSKRGDE